MAPIPPPTRRALLTLTVFLATCGLAGVFIGPRVDAQSSSDESAMRNSVKDFTGVYALVEQNYAEKMTPDLADKAIYDGAIPSMLHTLDPHSNFFDPKAYAQMREDQTGHYYGVGMTIEPQLVDGAIKIFVLFPAEGTPAFKAGLKPGDQILSVNGKPTTGLDTAGVASLLKGPLGTHVLITVSREGRDKPLTFDVVRGEIPHPSVDLAYEIQPGIGYIHISSFEQQTTAQEVKDALDSFEAKGPIKGLLIDLRGNPGGLLNEAIDVCDQFLKKGQVVVSQRGRIAQDHVEVAEHGETGPLYPIVVLVNRNTASAAEIVSGALQDHDRAIIVGETTFGKGLVQTIFNTSQATGLTLTTYHYYTPSGRLIQRPYDHLSLYDYYYVRDNPDKNNPNREVKLTDAGRTVYGGGGITPDDVIQPIKANHFQDSLGINTFFNFSRHYLATHTVTRGFTVDDDVMSQFESFLKSKNIPYTQADIDANRAWLDESIKSELFINVFGERQGLEVRADWDPQIQKALTYLPQAQALLNDPHSVNPTKPLTANASH